MSTTLLNLNKNEANFLIQINEETFEKALLEEYHKASAKEGKKSTPAFLSNQALLAQYPELKAITKLAIDKLMTFFYKRSIKELGIQPLMSPKITPRATTPGQPCIIEVQVALEPEVVLNQFEGLEVSYTPVIVSEDDIVQQLIALRKHYEAEDDDSKLLEKLHMDSIQLVTEEISRSLTTMAIEKTEFNKTEALINQLIKANPFEHSELIIEQQIMMEIERLRAQMGSQAMENYLKSSGRTMDDLKKDVHPQAEATIKRFLILSAINKKIFPEVTEEDIKETISKQQGLFMDSANDYETRRKRINETPGALDQIKQSIRLEKVMQYIVSKSILHENLPKSIRDELPESMK